MSLWIFVTLKRSGKGKYSFIKKNATRGNDRSNLWNSWERSKGAKFRRGVRTQRTAQNEGLKTWKILCLRGNSELKFILGLQETLRSISTVWHCKAVTEIILIIHFPMANIVCRALKKCNSPNQVVQEDVFSLDKYFFLSLCESCCRYGVSPVDKKYDSN